MPDILLGAPLAAAAMTALERFGTLHVLLKDASRETFFADIGPRIRCVIWPPFIGALPVDLVARLPAVNYIATMGAGYETIDVVHAAARGICVSNTPRAVTEDTADAAFYLVLAAVRRFPAAERFLRAGRWTPTTPPDRMPSLQDKTLGIIGLGRIGKAVARRAEAFGMRVVYFSRAKKGDVAWPWFGSLEEIARNCDVLLSVLPGGDVTRGMIGRGVFTALGPRGIFVNIGRGTTVDEVALIDALERGAIAGAGLDVFADEPNVPAKLIAMENVVLLPHVGGATDRVMERVGYDLIENVSAWARGAPPPDAVPEAPWRGQPGA